MPVSLRQIGKDGPKVPALGLGLMGLSAAYGEVPNDEERFAFLDRALEQGNTFWDSANIYADSEELVGRWFKRTGKRDQIFIASKFGIVMDGMNFKGIDSSGEYCKKACAKSLERLGVDQIDLFYAHRINTETPIEETMRALAELKAEGKIKYIGLCELSSSTLRRAYKIAPVDVVQVEYSPFVLDIENETGTNLLATCRELGVTVVPHSPLARGIITGTLTGKESVNGAGDLRGKMLPWFSDANIDANVKIAQEWKKLADKKGVTSTQLALAWMIAQGDDLIPIPGTKKIKYLEENWAALDIELTGEEVAEIRAFVESVEPAGYRSIESSRALAYPDTKEEA
ncbi:putative aldo/keto reductase [Lophiotrema nucula]|uniref:Putative aldo/keto reductase n=1 Tax=Lophiotrema nucula TaxID=690887 RepID=A0A6A5YG04_9PLEO|nr:putative aldo/keto reductase [Lophiotrema nucula]